MIIHTFVICAYKTSPYLEECIQSCLKQTSVRKKQSKIIVYTSTPSDFLSDICQKYTLDLFIGDRKSIGSDWNQALNYIETTYATIVHQDDIYFENYGSLIIDSFLNNHKANIVFTDYIECDTENKMKTKNLNLKIKTLGLQLLSLTKIKWFQRRIYGFGNFICCPAVSYNMERLNHYNFKFDEDFKMVVDWDAWERIMKYSGNIYYINNRAMAHRIHDQSETTANTRDHNREKEELIMFRRYWSPFFAKLLMNFYVHNQKTNE